MSTRNIIRQCFETYVDSCYVSAIDNMAIYSRIYKHNQNLITVDSLNVVQKMYRCSDTDDIKEVYDSLDMIFNESDKLLPLIRNYFGTTTPIRRPEDIAAFTLKTGISLSKFLIGVSQGYFTNASLSNKSYYGFCQICEEKNDNDIISYSNIRYAFGKLTKVNMGDKKNPIIEWNFTPYDMSIVRYELLKPFQKYIIQNCKPIDSIKVISDNVEEVSYNKIKQFTIDKSIRHARNLPRCFQDVLRRVNLEDISTFLAWHWILLNPTRYKGFRQVLWAQGPGFDGKTTWFSHILPNIYVNPKQSYAALSQETLDNKDSHASESYFNSALLGIDDLKSETFLMSGIGKRLSGHSIINVNPKGLKAFSFKPEYFMFCLSQDFPRLDLDDRSQVSRCAVVRWNKRNNLTINPNIVEECVSQLDKFVSYIVNLGESGMFDKHIINENNICNAFNREESIVIDEDFEIFKEWFNDKFELTDNKINKFNLTVKELNEMISAKFDKLTVFEMRRWKNKLHVKTKACCDNGMLTKRFTNVKVKHCETFESDASSVDLFDGELV